MIDKNIGYGYNDLTLLPTTFSDVKSRSEIYPFTYLEKLPIFASPMSTVVDLKNYNTYSDNKITPILPRNININERLQAARDGKWIALSLNEFESYLINDNTLLIQNNNYRILRICVDIANGHMSYLYELCKKAKEKSVKEDYTLYIMTGNIADPMTYRELCLMNIEGKNNNNIPVVDYIRVGIGGGYGCITSSNTSIHYPMASLIDECNSIKIYLGKFGLENCTKIIADGGIRNFSDVIKALALGADYVMIGGLFAKSLESCGQKMIMNYKGEYENCTQKEAIKMYERGAQVYTKFYGMASADGQMDINGKKTKTAEGITKIIHVEYKLHKWAENMESYLRSAMSYCGCFTLSDFIGKQRLKVNSINEINAVNK